MSSTDLAGVQDQKHPSNNKKREHLEQVVIRFCGDSGDGMQFAGTQFTNVSAAFGNDVSTLPDFPAEIRARRVRSAGSAVSNFTFPATTFTRRAMKSIRLSP